MERLRKVALRLRLIAMARGRYQPENATILRGLRENDRWRLAWLAAGVMRCLIEIESQERNRGVEIESQPFFRCLALLN